ncbi:ATP-binding cassette domain-containing protein [Pelagibacterium sediminicola]|uniref:ATP-binding cassette domain-containing protein n=1 Tax=Pelagibacterium sediminicola TaxID=2248761 RepID=UPI0018E51A00|nr:ATP-binding cassette domain-containing protein [Pelagibacterium sediminicola]
MNDETPIVSARGLRKRFGKTEVLHGLDFDIPAGRIYGLVGHNGAGKTTTLNALLGLTQCEGRIEVLGLDPFANRARLMENVAFISDVASLPRFLRVRELFFPALQYPPQFFPSQGAGFSRRNRHPARGEDQESLQGHDRPTPSCRRHGDRREAAGAR